MLQKKVIKERQEWTVTQMQNAAIMLTKEEKERIFLDAIQSYYFNGKIP